MNICAIILILMLTKCKCQYFNLITIQIFKNGRTFELVQADDVNLEKNVTNIDIFEQNVTVLKEGTFNNLPRLESIKIQRSGLKIIEKNAFKKLPKLMVLNLNFNSIKRLNDGIFTGLNITKLSLIGNGLEVMEEDVFKNLVYLKELDLSRNDIEFLPKHLLNEPKYLQQINFSYNKIKTIPEDFFWGAFYNIIGLDSFIDFGNNLINKLDTKSINGIKCIKRLSLNNNNIQQLDPLLFRKIMYMDELNLENNLLNSLNDDLLQFLQSVNTIKLLENPWNCTFVQKYTNWCDRHDKNNTMGIKVLSECNLS